MISNKQQIILLKMLLNYSRKIKRIQRKDVIQSLTNDNDFFENMRTLIKFGYVRNDGSGSYCFTSNGWAFANIIACQPNTDKKYRKVAQEISWIP